MRGVAAACVLFLASCYAPGLDHCAVQCGTQPDDCPAGLTCLNGFCQHPGGDGCGVTPPDAGSDGGPPPSCGSVALLNDEFQEGDGRSPFWQDDVYGNGGVSETGDALELTVTTGDSYAVRRSKRAYSLRGRTLRIGSVAALSVVPGGGYFVVQVQPLIESEDDAIQFAIDEGHLGAYDIRGGNEQTIFEQAYMDGSPVWLELQDQGGDVTFRISDNGTQYTDIAVSPGLAWTGRVYLQIYAGAEPTDVVPVTALIQSLDGGPPDDYCPVSGLEDDFESGAIDRQWYLDDQQCTPELSNGSIVMGPDGSTVSICELQSRAAWLLEDSAPFVEVATVPSTSSNVQTYFEVETVGGEHHARFVEQAGTLFFMKDDGIVGMDTYDPVGDRWWRLSLVGDELIWATASDGSSWVTRQTLTTSDLNGGVSVQIGASSPGMDLPGVGTATFDNVNVVP